MRNETAKSNRMDGHLQELTKAAKLAYQSIVARIDKKDHIPWGDLLAVKANQVKYFMQAIYDYAGLLAATRFFKKHKEPKLASQAEDLATKLRVGLTSFWQKKDGQFAWALSSEGYSSQLSTIYPHGKANLYGLAWVYPEKNELWKRLSEKDWSNSDNTKTPDKPKLNVDRGLPEWWMIACNTESRKKEFQQWRNQLIQEMLLFTRYNTDIERLGESLLTLLEGKKWLITSE